MMKRAAFILLVLLPATVAYANPVVVSPTVTAATVVVVMAALCLEIFLTTGVLVFSDMALGPTFLALIFGNVASYLGVLGPLAYHYGVHVVVAEVAVVVAEAVFIKLISFVALFQGDTFIELKWRYAFLAVMLGNTSSYYIGTLIGPEVL